MADEEPTTITVKDSLIVSAIILIIGIINTLAFHTWMYICIAFILISFIWFIQVFLKLPKD